MLNSKLSTWDTSCPNTALPLALPKYRRYVTGLQHVQLKKSASSSERQAIVGDLSQNSLVSPDLSINLREKEFSLPGAQRQRMHFAISSNTYACQTTIMAYPNFEKTFTLKTDVRDTALGAVLCQIDDEIERPVAYASRSLSSSESNYSATEKETIAVVWAVSHFPPYLYGRPFVVITDNQKLTFLHSVKEPKGRLASWLNELSQYEMVINYKAGSSHTDADALSLRPPDHNRDDQSPLEGAHNTTFYGHWYSSKLSR